MARWRVRDPGSFPPAFHRALHFEVGTHRIAGYFTKKGAKAAQSDWNIFNLSMRHFPAHKNAEAFNKYPRRTSVQWNFDYQDWELSVRVREPLSALLDLEKVLDVRLDTLD